MEKRLLPGLPLGLNRGEAAEYVGVSPSLFDQMVEDGRMPKPKRINARRVWDRRKLDLAFAGLPGDEEPHSEEEQAVSNPWDAVT